MSVLLALMGFGLLGAMMMSSDNQDDNAETGNSADLQQDTPETPSIDDTPDDPPAPPEDAELDTGASFLLRDDGTVEIELGEDETGSLAIFRYVDTEDSEEFFEVYEARFYLVPADVELPNNTSEERSNIPGSNGELITLEELEENLGLQFLGAVELELVTEGGDGFLIVDVSDELPPIEANAPYEIYDVEAQTDGDELWSFLPDDPLVTFNGVEEIVVTTDQQGGDGSDWLSIPEGSDGISLFGGGGDDLLQSRGNDAALDGQDGNDRLEAYGDNTLIEGGAGNDSILATGGDAAIFGGPGDDTVRSFEAPATLRGGDGDDRITVNAGDAFGEAGNDYLTGYGNTADVVLYGNEGADTLGIFGARATGHGGPGDDFLGVRNGATGYGDAGDDRMQVDAGGRADGGTGNDLIEVWEFNDETETAVLTAGEGADTFNMLIRNAYQTDAVPYARITDFDPAEDILEVGVWNINSSAVDSIALSESPDGSFTDVVVNIANTSGLPPGVAIIRLDGVTGLSQDAVVIVT
ncbi:MAG: calcium-binding protein [Rhodobacter sp.]|nr:calcium-binding protein [Rhodobacter sp.]